MNGSIRCIVSCWVVDCEWVTFEWTIIIISASHLKECERKQKKGVNAKEWH